MKNYIEELNVLIDGEVKTDEETICAHSTDASIFNVTPQIVIYPRHVEDIKNAVRFVSQNKKANPSLSITTRAAGTCMSGGSLNKSIILNTTHYLNKIKTMQGNCITVEPGVYYRDLEKETLKNGLILPSYTASKDLCAVGGMVANNSSGEKTLLYGNTGQYVRELKVVLADGNEYVFRKLNKTELLKKTRLQNFEGEVYRKLHALIVQKQEIIRKAKPGVSKNSAGYLIWDVEQEGSFDITKLFVGSQGTLGIFTEITFALVPQHTHARLLVIAIKDIAMLPEIVNAVRAHNPESFECYDKNTYALAEQYMKEATELVVTEKDTALTLLAEFAAPTEEEAITKVRKCGDALQKISICENIIDTKSAESYWKIRRGSFSLLRDHAQDNHRVAPFIDDIVVSPEKLVQFLPKLAAILKKYDLIYTIAGHIGDGNFHLIPIMDMSQPKIRERIIPLAKEVFQLVFSFKGSMAGEHNDGIIRTPFLKDMYGEEVVCLFQEIKHIFDPENIFNPGKKVGGTIDYAVCHFSHNNTCAHL